MMKVSLKFFAAGSYAIIYIYANELFPTGIRNTGMGICSMVARKTSFSWVRCDPLSMPIVRDRGDCGNDKQRYAGRCRLFNESVRECAF
jgi:hypothetical protein